VTDPSLLVVEFTSFGDEFSEENRGSFSLCIQSELGYHFFGCIRVQCWRVDCITSWAILSLFWDDSSLLFTELETDWACGLIVGRSLTCGVHISFIGHISHYRRLKYEYGGRVSSFWARSIDVGCVSGWKAALYYWDRNLCCGGTIILARGSTFLPCWQNWDKGKVFVCCC